RQQCAPEIEEESIERVEIAHREHGESRQGRALDAIETRRYPPNASASRANAAGRLPSEPLEAVRVVQDRATTSERSPRSAPRGKRGGGIHAISRASAAASHRVLRAAPACRGSATRLCGSPHAPA